MKKLSKLLLTPSFVLSVTTSAFAVTLVSWGVEDIDMSVTVMGQKLNLPLFFSPTALQRLFHYQGERAVGKVAEKFGTFFGISSLATVSIEEIANSISSPKMFQLYIHKDKGLNDSMIEKCIEYDFDAIALTVDTIVGGNRERDFYTGFTSPPRLNVGSFISFATHPRWTLNYLLREGFSLPQLQDHIKQGTDITISVGEYFNSMLDQNMDWDTVADINKKWGRPLCLKGIMSVEDAKKAVDVGASAIMVSNHGGRQLDGSRSPFDQVKAISDAVGNKLEIILDGGVRRGTHVLKALAAGATACSFGKAFLFSLGAGGQQGVEKLLENMHKEIRRNMILMGCKSVKDLDRSKIIYRN